MSNPDLDNRDFNPPKSPLTNTTGERVGKKSFTSNYLEDTRYLAVYFYIELTVLYTASRSVGLRAQGMIESTIDDSKLQKEVVLREALFKYRGASCGFRGTVGRHMTECRCLWALRNLVRDIMNL